MDSAYIVYIFMMLAWEGYSRKPSNQVKIRNHTENKYYRVCQQCDHKLVGGGKVLYMSIIVYSSLMCYIYIYIYYDAFRWGLETAYASAHRSVSFKIYLLTFSWARDSYTTHVLTYLNNCRRETICMWYMPPRIYHQWFVYYNYYNFFS